MNINHAFICKILGCNVRPETGYADIFLEYILLGYPEEGGSRFVRDGVNKQQRTRRYRTENFDIRKCGCEKFDGRRTPIIIITYHSMKQSPS